MNCKKCGAQLVEDAVFCSQCGTRVDGKTTCKFCGREIVEGSVFCPYCGKRLDGKHTCTNCGTAFIGNFCPKCGKGYGVSAQSAPVNPAPARATATPVAAAPAPAAAPAQAYAPVQYAQKPAQAKDKTATRNVINIIKQSLLYGALCLMFICCFLMSFNLKVVGRSYDTGRVSGSVSMGATSFAYLIDLFKNAPEVFADMGTYGMDYFPEFKVGYYLMSGLIAACIALVMIVCIVYFILGTVKYVKAMVNKKPIEMSKYVITPAIIMLAVMIFMCSILTVSGSSSDADAQMRVTIGAMPTVTVVLVSLLLAGAAVLHFFNGEKITTKRILNYALNAGGLIFAYILVQTLTASAFNAESEDASVGLSTSATYIGLLFGIGVMPGEYMTAEVEKALASCTVMFIFYIILFVLAVALMWVIAKNVVAKKPKGVLPCVLAGVSYVLAIAYLVVVCVSKQYMEETATIGAAPICGVVFSLMVAAAVIVACILVREKCAPKPNLAYAPEGYAAPDVCAPAPEYYEPVVNETVATETAVTETEQVETVEQSEPKQE